MEKLGDYTRGPGVGHDSILTVEFGRFATYIGLRNFQENPSPDVGDTQVIGLSAGEFKEQVTESEVPNAIGAHGQLRYDFDFDTFEARVVYDKEFFAARATDDGRPFENILPLAVEYEVCKMSSRLEGFANTEVLSEEEERWESEHADYESLYACFEQALEDGQFGVFVQYLATKVDAEFPPDIDRYIHETKHAHVAEAYIEVLLNSGQFTALQIDTLTTEDWAKIARSL